MIAPTAIAPQNSFSISSTRTRIVPEGRVISVSSSGVQPRSPAASGASGNERSLLEIAQQKPEVVLLDVSMPGLTGDRIAELLKETGLLKTGLIVFFSSRTAAELEELVVRTGASGYIRKDLATGEFVSQVHYWVGEARRLFPSA